MHIDGAEDVRLAVHEEGPTVQEKWLRRVAEGQVEERVRAALQILSKGFAGDGHESRAHRAERTVGAVGVEVLAEWDAVPQRLGSRRNHSPASLERGHRTDEENVETQMGLKEREGHAKLDAEPTSKPLRDGL